MTETNYLFIINMKVC